MAGAVVAGVVGCAGAPSGSGSAPAPAAAMGDSTTRAGLAAAEEIAGLHTRWREALAKRDTAFFANVLLDNFEITGNQVTLDKQQFMAAVAADSGGVEPSQFEQTNVRLYDRVAVVTGLIRYDIPGEAEPALTRYSEVWVREQNRWRAAHLHYNPVAPVGRGNR
ncbi:MAG TPA: nuclear transport factor 2 family protein [Gemmatimonadales bacterium]|jgi:ketosteroid isomerase-like protein|nr:nuclear transport factor 2 family protein [Gemmatimonadales bacterium]